MLGITPHYLLFQMYAYRVTRNATIFGTKIKFHTFFLFNQVTSFAYIIDDSCIITFNLDCIMKLI